MQALGPVALVSLLLNTGLIKAVPGSDINENPNLPEDPELQERYNRAAVQASPHCSHALHVERQRPQRAAPRRDVGHRSISLQKAACRGAGLRQSP